MKKLILIIIISLFFPLKQGLALKVSTLYQAELPVASQSEDLKEQAVRDGFLQVLMKVSGDPEILLNPTVKDNLSRAGFFVKDISYSSPTTSSSQYRIRIQYDPDDVNRLLKKAGIAYWGDQRPLILVWLLVVNQKQIPEILGTETPSDILTKMKEQSKKYGLPLIFPLMDSGELNQISAKDITDKDIAKLKEAAKRYGADGILIGSIQENGNTADSQWQLILNKDQWDWTLSDKTAGGVIASTIDEVTQTLSKRFVVESGNAPELTLYLQVSNVNARSDLVKLMQYLEELSPVRAVQLSQMTGSVVDLTVLIQGSISTFQQSASVGERLIFKSKDEAKNKLVYEWMH